ncbi:MAG: hypothetical protein KF736_04180 [Acidobacteria bacterium]|nr:hypothetical protein [Acidobacteriota bacterium]
MRSIGALCAALAAMILVSAASGQNLFQGYSFTVEADIGGACPIRYLPSAGAGNAVEVFVAGTDQKVRATGITPCDGSTLQSSSRVVTNGDGRWCFSGPEPMYDLKLTNGVSYLWYPISRDTGLYNVKDFRPVTRAADGKYTFSEPSDYTRTIRNAIAFATARQGGTIRFPDGDYVVGTLDGVRRDPSYQAITLTSGLIVEGAGGNASVSNSNLPWRNSPTRIRLRHPDQTIFRIGGCTNKVVIRDMELMGNSELYGEARRDSTRNYGVEGLGKWLKDPRNGMESPNSSQIFRFENVTFQNLDRGIYIHNANDDKCTGQDQVCSSWQFDYVLVDHCHFLNNKTAIWVDTQNTDWKITNSVFNYTAQNAPGDGIRIQKAGSMLIEQSWGGGYDYAAGIGGTFIYVDTIGTLTIVSSGSERGKRSLYTNPAGAIRSEMITMIGGGFGDKVELRGYLNFISVGAFYGPDSIDADPTVTITSNGDRFCHDPNVFGGHCKDAQGRALLRPNFNGGRMMFQTGRLPEGRGDTRIEGRPNLFGYNVELRDGLMQYDPNITFADITKWASGADGRPPVQDGAIVYCKDCKRGGVCSVGRAGVDGAFAKRINGRWMCD